MNFKFTQEEINIIANAVAEMPFKVAEPVITKIREQYDEQQEQDSTPTEEM